MPGRTNSTNPPILRYRRTLTTLSFTAPDGTEYTLRDDLSRGMPFSHDISPSPACPPVDQFTRGRFWSTADGTSAVFESDLDVFDTTGDPVGPVVVSGVMTLRDGTRFRIVNSQVRWQQDRNGNRVFFDYDGNGRLSTVTDSLGRQITIVYFNPATTGKFAEVTYPGVSSSSRTITLLASPLGNALRTGETLETEQDLFGDPAFPSHGFLNADVPFNPHVLGAVQLPSGHRWSFEYNSYGEVAQAETPLGGKIQYDTKMGGGVFGNVDFSLVEFWRAVHTRRTYPDGATGEDTATYTNLYEATNPVVEKHTDGSGVVLSSVEHFFGGGQLTGVDPAYGTPDNTGYRHYLEGKETKTVFKSASGAATLRTIERTYVNRTPVLWTYSAPGIDPYTSDPNTENDPQLREVKTTLETGQVSRVTYDYDNPGGYNNVTSEKYYDYGGTLLKQVDRTYMPEPWVGKHLVSLVATETVSGRQYDGSFRPETLTELEHDKYDPLDLDNLHAGLLNRASFGYPSPRDPNYNSGPGMETIRGNVTEVRHKNPLGGAEMATTRTWYDIAGNAVKTFDPLATSGASTAHRVDVEYESLHWAFPTQTKRYSGTLTLPITRVFDQGTGALTSETGFNADTYSYQYNDPDDLDRLTAEVRPGGDTAGGYGQTKLFYSAYNEPDQWMRSETSLDTPGASPRTTTVKTYVDGFGRPTQTVQLSDPQGQTTSETYYDGDGQDLLRDLRQQRDADRELHEHGADAGGKRAVAPRLGQL